MRQYSIEAIAMQPVAIPEPLVMLDKGFNAFQVVTNDIEALLDLLKVEGVTVSKVYHIAQDEPPSLDHELLPGETRETLGLL